MVDGITEVGDGQDSLSSSEEVEEKLKAWTGDVDAE